MSYWVKLLSFQCPGGSEVSGRFPRWLRLDVYCEHDPFDSLAWQGHVTMLSFQIRRIGIIQFGRTRMVVIDAGDSIEEMSDFYWSFVFHINCYEFKKMLSSFTLNGITAEAGVTQNNMKLMFATTRSCETQQT